MKGLISVMKQPLQSVTIALDEIRKEKQQKILGHKGDQLSLRDKIKLGATWRV
jgi:hypothetical protein